MMVVMTVAVVALVRVGGLVDPPPSRWYSIAAAALVDKLRAAHADRIIALDIKPCTGPIDQFILVDLSDPFAVDDAIHRLPESIDVLFNDVCVVATLPIPVVVGVNVLAPRRLIGGLNHRMPPASAIVTTASTAGGGFTERMTQILELLGIDD